MRWSVWASAAAALSLDGLNCDHELFQNHYELAHLFYVVRSDAEHLRPYDFEDPVRSYPEEPPVAEHIRAQAELLRIFCVEAVALEWLLDAERHLSLMARSTSPAELYGNASQACEELRSFQRLAEQFTWAEKYQELLGMGLQHLMASWHRLGFRPEKLCASLENEAEVRLVLGDVEVHRKCKMRAEQGYRAGDLSSGCKVEGLWRLLPKAMRAAIAAPRRSGVPKRELGAGCGTRFVATGYMKNLSMIDSRGFAADTCRGPFLTYHPFPMASLTACKYCMVGSMLNLQPGEELLEFGPGCGLGAAWLAAAFGVQVTAIDLFQQHLEGTRASGSQVGVDIRAVCQGDVAALEAFDDESFDVVITNGAMTKLGSAAAPCAVLRRQLLRVLKPGTGRLWFGGLHSPYAMDLYQIGAQGWMECLRTLEEGGDVSYVLFSELETMGVAESWDAQELTLLLVKHSSSALTDEADIYACRAAEEQGFSKNKEQLEVLQSLLPSIDWSLAGSFAAGPSFWPCAQQRLERIASNVAEGMWALQFAPGLDLRHVLRRAESWRPAAPPERSGHEDVWLEDIIVPTGVDVVLDHWEQRLEELGLPASHSDPWHILRYDPGYRAHFLHTDCGVEHVDPSNDRYATVLIWLSECWNESLPCSPVRTEATGVDDLADGATVFPQYGLRMRMPPGGLVVYSSFTPGLGGRCNPRSAHFAAPLGAAAPQAKLVLQKWYYASPVEPSTPIVPLAVCDENPSTGAARDRAQCKHFVMPPQGMASQRVQDGLGRLQRRMAEPEEGDQVQQVVALATSRELRELSEALEDQVAGGSLGRSPHWYAMLTVGNVEILGAQVGLSLPDPLPRLRAALRRCGGCTEVMRSLLLQLLAALQERFQPDLLDEALVVLRRWARLDAAAALELAPQVAALLAS
ncbi:unnamed protein product [Effrenium voratum]|nr:unnamed protein product [Effrenium voratum]